MRRWTRVGLAVTATLAGMIALTPPAHAAGGTAISALKAGRTKATNPFTVLPPELLTCIAAQAGPVDQVRLSRVCQRWNTTTHQPPMSVQNITVARTQTQLTAALDNAQASAIVIIPDEDMTIGNAPANPKAHITIHDTKKSCQSTVEVRANIRVNASGTATVYASGSAQVTASDTAKVWAHGSSQVTASDNVKVSAYGSSQVTASDNAMVSASGSVQVTASGNTKVWAYGSAQVTTSDNAKVMN